MLDASGRALQIGDTGTRPGLVIIYLHQSKTDQLGRGPWVQLASCPEREICRGEALDRYLDMCPLAGRFLFLHFDLMLLTLFQFQPRVGTDGPSPWGL